MKCWVCSARLMLRDVVAELPIVGALVHPGCYERVTGQPATLARTLRDYLQRSQRRPAAA